MNIRATEIELTTEFEGKTYSGSFSIDSNVVTVHSVFGSKSTQKGGSTAESIALILLREILRDAKARGDIP